MIPKSSKEEILNSLFVFDNEFRNLEGWVNWEKNKAQKWAISQDDKIYPPKKIISIATKLPVNSFSGGPESNNFLQEYGFKIIPMENSSKEISIEKPSGSIRESFQHLLESYLQIGETNVFGKKSPVWEIFKNAEQAVISCNAVSNREHLKVYGRAGQGKWTSVPWVGIFDRRETKTSKKGLNCGFLFCADMSGVYLTLNQGVTDIITELGRNEGRSKLILNKEKIRRYFSQLEEVGFQLDDEIDLKTQANLSKDYEIGIITYKYYHKDNLPSDLQFNEDLDALLNLYQSVVEQGKITNSNYWIFQANPKYFDIDNAIITLSKIHWSIKQHANKIAKDDKVFFWKSGDDSGILAYGVIETDPGDYNIPEDESKFDIEPKKFDSELRVRIKIIKRFIPPILRKNILSIPELKDLSILKQPVGTNFPVTEEEANVLLEIISPQNNKQVWLVSPGKNAELWDDFYRQGIIAIGWDGTDNLNRFPTIQSLTDHIIEVFESENQPRNDARACFDFAHTMKVGDLILVKKGRKAIVGYGYITGEYKFDEERTFYKHTRTVRWEERGSWKFEGGLPVKTVTEISGYPSFVEDLKILVGLVQPEEDEVSPAEERQEFTNEEAYKDLFISGEEFDAIVDFWKSKKNIILQGPPGVGKTFIA